MTKVRPSCEEPPFDAGASPFFETGSPLVWSERVKLVLLLPLAVIRVILLLEIGMVALIFSRVAMLGLGDEEPLGSWRRALAQNCIRASARGALFVLGFWHIPVSGKENLKEAERLRAVVVINHVSYLDGFLIEYLIFSSGVAKASVAKIPIIGTLTRVLRMIFVERRSTLGGPAFDSATKIGKGVKSQSTGNIQRINDRLRDPRFPLVWLAPEGTTSSGSQLLRFKPGAFVGGNPVLPVVLTFPYQRFNIAFTETIMWMHALRLLTQVLNYAEIACLPVHVPDKAEAADPAEFAENVRRRMAEHMRVPLVDQGLEEFAVLLKNRVHVAWDGRTVKGSVDKVPEQLAQVKLDLSRARAEAASCR
eukprot:CAMPEP_0118937438 /NCGR_PEP_ID=MMETSP1169-20130426/22749_1 /TAXON_ID=36882 /ORGANISM="Pyramimonas obovata, Strain CCMP722" /LENGTH=363 /DNA_ID=CAMNT_0006881065 /DNA_START=80 /DNA_END=1167 /DNA_ORIENTATION=+